MKKLDRRDFLKKGSLAAITASTVLGVACSAKEEKKEIPNINFNKQYKWKLTTTWPPNFPILGEGCKMVAEWIRVMSGGRMEITVYGGGELIPALEAFDAVSNGAIEMGSGAAYYWAGKIPAAQFFASVPFGMNAQQVNAWLLSGGGMALWETNYAQYNLVPFPSGNTGVQMGGWFNKEINSMEDIKGLKMRMPGLGGKVLDRAGGTAVLSPGSELYTNLERGIIDATEWVGPYHDYIMGFPEVAKYYYYPGWHEVGTVFEMFVNKEKLESLPMDLQEIVKTAILRLNMWMLSEFEAKNSIYLDKIKNEGRVALKKFPREVLDAFKKLTKEAIEEMAEADPTSRKIYTAYRNFEQTIKGWARISEKVYYEEIQF